MLIIEVYRGSSEYSKWNNSKKIVDTYLDIIKFFF